jgi:hypothetical protein
MEKGESVETAMGCVKRAQPAVLSDFFAALTERLYNYGMQGKKVQEFIRRQPFVPFDIKTSDTRVYTVDHPEFISITRDLSIILYQTPEDDRTVWIDTANIVALEVANRPVAA